MSPAFGKRRALGQHFLRDSRIIHRICEVFFTEAEKSGCRSMLEIGPGKGAITESLLGGWLARLREGSPLSTFQLVEKDRALAQYWRTKSSELEKTTPSPLRVLEADFVQAPQAQWQGEPPLGVVSNLPYSSGTAILTRLAQMDSIPFMVLMFQAEVAQRLRAFPSSHAWGSLSLWIQNHWDVTSVCEVPPLAFSPPPDVNSEVVLLRRRKHPRISFFSDPRFQNSAHLKELEQIWEELLKACFAHRRKMLRSGLPRSGLFLEAIERAQIDPTLRAEALEWEQWNTLLQSLYTLRAAPPRS